MSLFYHFSGTKQLIFFPKGLKVYPHFLRDQFGPLIKKNDTPNNMYHMHYLLEEIVEILHASLCGFFLFHFIMGPFPLSI